MPWLLMASLVTASTGVARAEVPPDIRATAELLYQEAYQLSGKGQYERACKMYEESDRLDPANGTKLELAKCYEATGRLASAWALYRAVADSDAMAGKQARSDEASERAKAIEPKLPRLTINVPEPIARIEGLIVKRNGMPVSRALWGLPVPVDLGDHKLIATAPGHEPWEGDAFVERPDQRLTVNLPPLSRAKPNIPVIVLGGVGLAGIVIGGACGAAALVKWADVKDMAPQECTDPSGFSGCTPKLAADGAAASRLATTSTVGFAVGGAALAAATVVWIVGAKSKPRTGARIEVLPAVSLTGAGAILQGAF
jgi:hypothetical protein